MCVCVCVCNLKFYLRLKVLHGLQGEKHTYTERKQAKSKPNQTKPNPDWPSTPPCNSTPRTPIGYRMFSRIYKNAYLFTHVSIRLLLHYTTVQLVAFIHLTLNSEPSSVSEHTCLLHCFNTYLPLHHVDLP